MMVELRRFRLYSAAEVVRIHWKPYFRFLILIFSEAGRVLYDSLSWCGVVAVSGSSGSGTVTRANS